jgi:uncharacterized cupredoxin-like copper-binding protein
VLCAAAVFLVAAGCSSSDDGGVKATSSDEGGVSATEADFSITLDPTSATAGDVTFNIQNDAAQTHEFVVFKTDLAPDALPTDDTGAVDEAGKGVTHIDEVEDVTAGSSATLTVNLEAGAYVMICNLPGHYSQGMHTAFSVT